MVNKDEYYYGRWRGGATGRALNLHSKSRGFDCRPGIGATTVATGENWSPTFRLGDQQCIGPRTSWPWFSKTKKIHSK